MSLPTITVQTGYDPIPTGEYTAELTTLRVVDNPFDANKKQLEWTFTLRGGAHDGRTLRAYSSLSPSSKSKLVQWASALLQRNVAQVDETLDLNTLIGRSCRIVVLCRPKPDGSGEMYNRVDSVLPIQQTSLI